MAKSTKARPEPTAPSQRSEGGAASSSGPHIEVVGIVASAGGLDAISGVLRSLPSDFSAAVVVAQHLGGQGSLLVPLLQRRSTLPVDWAHDGEPIRAGHVTVCPARSALDILPDWSCAVRRLDYGIDRSLDALLVSLAHSFGAGALGVVLTGMGSDGAKGAAELRRLGGTVFAQSEETADYPSMPHAAIAAGVDLVLPLHEVAKVIAEVVAGARMPRPRSESEAAE